jgi:quinol monooxygenase YgiN
MTQAMATYLLSIRGTLSPTKLEDARTIHNQTAGAPASVAAAQSLGDLSHMVYVPANPGADNTGEFLILDIWNNMDGLNQFFANKDVQEQAGQIFKERDPVVWSPAEGFYSYHLPSPYGKNTRIVSTVRSTLASIEQAQTVHNTLVNKLVNKARGRSNLSHVAYLRLAAPGTPEALEFFAVDTWMDAEGMAQHYQDPEFLDAFGKLFAAPPVTGMWSHPAGEWVEW